jgi:hypothetical protein
VTEAERIREWLIRVADDVQETFEMYRVGTVTKQELLDFISQSYDTLLVMKKVAHGTAYMRGISPKGI